MPKPLGIMVMTALVGLLSLFANNATALSVTIDNSDAVTNSFELTPGTSATSGEVVVSIESNDTISGYTLSITGPNTMGALIGTNSSNILDPIATNGAIDDPDDFNDDTWGLLPSRLCTDVTADTCLDNSTYQPAPGNTSQIIDVTTSANDNEETYTLVAGAKISATKASDVYTGTLMIVITANPLTDVYYEITYDGNGADGDVPSNESGVLDDSGTVTISSEEPIRYLYVFDGWCTGDINNDEFCTGDTLQPNDTYTFYADITATSIDDLRLTAIWKSLSYEITYDGNLAEGDVPSNEFGNFNGSDTITISNEEPYACDYVFLGWCTGTIYWINQRTQGCNGETLQPGSTYTFPSVDINITGTTYLELQAIWGIDGMGPGPLPEDPEDPDDFD